MKKKKKKSRNHFKIHPWKINCFSRDSGTIQILCHEIQKYVTTCHQEGLIPSNSFHLKSVSFHWNNSMWFIFYIFHAFWSVNKTLGNTQKRKKNNNNFELELFAFINNLWLFCSSFNIFSYNHNLNSACNTKDFSLFNNLCLYWCYPKTCFTFYELISSFLTLAKIQ